MEVFVQWLEEDVRAIANIKVKEMIFTEEDKKRFNKEKECWILLRMTTPSSMAASQFKYNT